MKNIKVWFTSTPYYKRLNQSIVDDNYLLLDASFDENKKINKKYDFIFIENKLNDFERINKVLIFCNNILKDDGLLVGYGETLNLRKKYLQNKYGRIYLFFEVFDVIYNRVLPNISYRLLDYIDKRIKLPIKRNNRALSKAEILGRLVYCGFEIEEIKEDDELYFIVKKVSQPLEKKNRSYELFFKMDRVGKNGQIIGVYKLRTMYPYSEFIQDYIMKENGLMNTGKITNDYRIPRWGRIFRKFWIDELPMILNLLKGELKIYGVRPLSKTYFDKYPKEMQELRTKVTPGLIPPYYYDLPNSFEEIIESERKYINAYLLNPIKTDIKYFLVSVWNIVVKGKRSG